MKNIIFGVGIVLLSGCAATYKPPMQIDGTVKTQVSASKNKIMSAARRVLVSGGYQILNTDGESGTISTAFKNYRLDPQLATCGTTLGLDYLLDNRTTTRVSYGLIVEDNRFSVTAAVEGEYKPGVVDQDITLTCYSRGELEKQLTGQILTALK